MHPLSNIIPDCQSPANDAAGVVAAKPDAGGGVGPLLLDSNGIPLQLDDYVVLQDGRTGKIVSIDCVRGVFVVLCERNFFYLDFKHSTSCRLARRYRPADVTATEPVVPYTPDTVYSAFELLRRAHYVLTCCPLPLGPGGHAFVDDLVTFLNESDRQRMSLAAAHAYEMQSGGVA